MNFASDFPAMCLDFGVNATLAGTAVRGIEDRAPGIAQGLIGGVSPTFMLPTSETPLDPRGLALNVSGGTNYVVRDYAHDGTGVTTLQLEAQ